MTKRKLGLLADDFTGAMDAGAQFALLGLSTVFERSEGEDTSAELLVISTESREATADEAIRRTEQTVARLNNRQIFKKIDSTLRGNITAEIIPLLHGVEIHQALICPAIPELVRIVRSGELWVNGVRLHETDFRNDPTFPRNTAQIAQILRVEAGKIPLEIIRSGKQPLQLFLDAQPQQFLVADAETDADLDVLARAVIENNLLPCGALGFARAWGKVLKPGLPPLPRQNLNPQHLPPLFILGSHHPITTHQWKNLIRQRDVISLHYSKSLKSDAVITALKTGKAVILHMPEENIASVDERAEMMDAMCHIAAPAVIDGQTGGLIACGGETAAQFCRILGTQAVQILGEILSGTPYGKLIGGQSPQTTIVTKAGGFGDENVLIHIYDHFVLHNQYE